MASASRSGRRRTGRLRVGTSGYGSHMKHLKDPADTIGKFLQVARRLGGRGRAIQNAKDLRRYVEQRCHGMASGPARTNPDVVVEG